MRMLVKPHSKKTKCIPFITSSTKDFMPQLALSDGVNLEVIYKLKLVGIVISSELTWNKHVDYTVSRVNGVSWQSWCTNRQTDPILYLKNALKIRSILMFSAKEEPGSIFGSQYRSYRNTLFLTSLPRLDTLRQEATLKWAIKAQRNPLHSDMFPFNKSTVETRGRNKYLENIYFTTRYYILF